MQKRTLLAALFAAAGLLSAAGFSPACAAERVYVAAMDAAYPPFGSQDMKTGKYVGYDVDIIEAIAIFNLTFYIVRVTISFHSRTYPHLLAESFELLAP